MNKTKAYCKGIVSVVLTGVFLASCGGGGGGGVSSAPGLHITLPPSVIPPHTVVSAIERSSSPQLDRVRGLSVLDGRLSGAGVQVGVVDSGVMASHDEFDGRVHGGGDWQGGGDGTSDPHGHGTHVASLLIASGDGNGMVGIAPQATVFSYRILNERGVFGGRSGNVMVPAVLGHVDSHDLSVVNNSWSSIYEINDFSKTTIAAALSAELPAYQDIATPTGPIMVWAAGNDGESQVSIRSGLPYHFAELQPNWLTVVATDLNGREPRYTNQCGVSAPWCLAAPGGGDDQQIEGLLGAAINGAYTRKSGTSMAAPLVSGALAVLIDRFPGMTPRQASQRLIATARLDHLTTATGCTLTSCGEATMREVFGNGMIDLDAALSPISPAALASAGGEASLSSSFLLVPSILGPGLKDGLDGAVAVIRDDFDDAYFTLPISGFAVAQPHHQQRQEFSFDSDGMIAASTMTPGMRFAASGSAPAELSLPARLIDIPGGATHGWAGYGFDLGRNWARLGFGSGDDRQSLHLMLASKEATPHWVGMGADHSRQWLDGVSGGAFATATASSLWGFGGLQQPLGSAFMTVEGLIGQTKMAGSGIISAAEIQFSSATIRLSSDSIPETGWSVALALPPALDRGWVDLAQPSLTATGGLAFDIQRYDLDLDQREIRSSIDFNGRFDIGMQYHLQVSHSIDAGHIAGEESSAAQMNFILLF